MSDPAGRRAGGVPARWRLGEDGQFEQVLQDSRDGPPRPALFLDRDGVIVEDVHHLRRPADVRMDADAAPIIARANAAGVPVVVITNQSGIGLGLFTWQDFLDVQARILAELADAGAWIDAVFACPNHPAADPPYGHPDHPCRKPNPGMLLRAAACLPIDLSRSWVVGDRWRDLEAGRRAGLAGGLLVGEGRDEGEAATGPEDDAFRAIVADRRFIHRRGHSIADAAVLPMFLPSP